MDGSNDVNKIDDELFLVQWCDIDGIDEKIHSRMDFLQFLGQEVVMLKACLNVYRVHCSKLVLVHLMWRTAKCW